MNFLRAVFYLIGMIVSAIVVASVAFLLFAFSFKTRYWVISKWAKFNIWTLKWICGLDYHVKGKENIPEGNGIIFCKHQSAWETLALQEIFPPQVYLLKRELLWIPFFGWGLAMIDSIAIDRSSGSKAMKTLLDQGKQRLLAGRWIVIYPEGHRMPPGVKGTYRKGGSILAQKSQYPVVPVAHNAGDYWPRKSFYKKPGTIQVVIGPPIDTRNKTAHEINDLAQEWIENEMRNICPGYEGRDPD